MLSINLNLFIIYKHPKQPIHHLNNLSIAYRLLQTLGILQRIPDRSLVVVSAPAHGFRILLQLSAALVLSLSCPIASFATTSSLPPHFQLASYSAIPPFELTGCATLSRTRTSIGVDLHRSLPDLGPYWKGQLVGSALERQLIGEEPGANADFKGYGMTLKFSAVIACGNNICNGSHHLSANRCTVEVSNFLILSFESRHSLSILDG